MSSLVAVFQIGSMGDAIVSLPSLLSIKELIPECSEYLLVSGSDSKVKVMAGDVFEMAWKPKAKLNYSISGQRLRQLYSASTLLAKLRYYRPKYCVALMPAERESQRLDRDKRFFRAAGVKELLGFQSLPLPDPEATASINVEETESFLRFQRLWGREATNKFGTYARVPVLRASEDASYRVKQWLAKNRRYPGKRLIVLSPYSNVSSRDLPEQTIGRLLSHLATAAEAEIVIVGGSKDAERAGKILQNSNGLNACGVFSIQESAALLKACHLAVCTESGPMHLAAAVGAPLLVAFSRINRNLSRWLPFGQHSTILYREVACAGCFSRQCVVPGHPCMENITADQLISSALKILNGIAVLDGSLNGTRVLNW